MATTSKSLEEIRAIRNRWAEMPEEEVEAEQKKLLASAMRRIARIRKTGNKAKPAVKAPIPGTGKRRQPIVS